MEFELPDGTALALEDGATGADAAAAIGAGLARAALAVKVDGELRDLSRPLPETGGKLEIVTERTGGEALSLGARLLKPADDIESAEGFQVPGKVRLGDAEDG